METHALRNVVTSGGLFTENILLKLRDKPDQLDIGKVDEQRNAVNKEEVSKHENQLRGILEDLRETWFKVSETIGSISMDEMINSWFCPLFSALGFQVEPYDNTGAQEEDADPLSMFHASHHDKAHERVLFHLVNGTDEFDTSNPANPFKKSHHDACQFFINRVQVANWLVLSNGKNIRILTKYFHSYSRGYIEFGLENILSKKDEKEFFLLYRLMHSSRFDPFHDDKSLMDAFQELSIEQGVKIGENLRNNVHDVLELLGDELIHQNSRFHHDLKNGGIDLHAWYHELLQILYRLIFLLYAEKREMLPDASSLFFKQFSLSLLRLQAEKPIKRDQNVDLWYKLFILFKMVKEGNAFLNVNAFDGNLFDETSHPIINSYRMKLSNDALLNVIRKLTTAAIGNAKQRINFLEVSVEEVGSIYESLLDYQPRFENDKFYLYISEEARKNSGSYYTNRDVVQLMIERTIIPYIEKILGGNELSTEAKIERILDLKICDPACGGGSFLIGALDLVGKILARLRSGQEEPPLDVLETARRDVLENCTYGVDLNPFAIELTKLSLWIHACVKDKPLNFLDHHVKVGNSLIGTNVRKFLKKKEGSRQASLFEELDYLTSIKREFLRLRRVNDDNLINIKQKQKIFQEIIASPLYIKSKRIADLYTYQVYISGSIPENFDAQTYNILNVPDGEWKIREIVTNEKKALELTEEKRFFHWDLEFPEVFFRNNPGFDIVIGNPPYLNISKIKDEEIKYLKTYKSAFRRFDAFVLFGERSLKILRKAGFHAFIIPDKILTETYAKEFRKLVFTKFHWNAFIDLTEISVFPAAAVSSIVYIIENVDLNDTSTVIHCYGKNQIRKVESWNINIKDFLIVPEYRINLNWKTEVARIVSKIIEKGIKSSKIMYVSVGVQPGTRDRFFFSGNSPDCKNNSGICKQKYCLNEGQNVCFPSLKGENLLPFFIEYNDEHVHYLPESLHRPAFPELFENEKILFRKVTGEQGLICALDKDYFYTDDSIFCAIPKYQLKALTPVFLSKRGIKFEDVIGRGDSEGDDDEKTYDRGLTIYLDEFLLSKIISLEYLVAIFNSGVFSFYYKNYIGGGLNVFPEHIRNLYIPDFSILTNIREDLEAWKKWNEYNFLKEHEDELDSFKIALRDLIDDKITIETFLNHLDEITKNNYEKNLIIQYFLGFISTSISSLLKSISDSKKKIISSIENKEGQKECERILKTKQGRVFLKNQDLVKYIPSDTCRVDIFDTLLWNKDSFKESVKIFKGKKEVDSFFEGLYEKYHPLLFQATDAIQKMKTVIDEILYRIFNFSQAEIEIIKES